MTKVLLNNLSHRSRALLFGVACLPGAAWAADVIAVQKDCAVKVTTQSDISGLARKTLLEIFPPAAANPTPAASPDGSAAPAASKADAAAGTPAGVPAPKHRLRVIKVSKGSFTARLLPAEGGDTCPDVKGWSVNVATPLSTGGGPAPTAAVDAKDDGAAAAADAGKKPPRRTKKGSKAKGDATLTTEAKAGEGGGAEEGTKTASAPRPLGNTFSVGVLVGYQTSTINNTQKPSLAGLEWNVHGRYEMREKGMGPVFGLGVRGVSGEAGARDAATSTNYTLTYSQMAAVLNAGLFVGLASAPSLMIYTFLSYDYGLSGDMKTTVVSKADGVDAPDTTFKLKGMNRIGFDVSVAYRIVSGLKAGVNLATYAGTFTYDSALKNTSYAYTGYSATFLVGYDF